MRRKTSETGETLEQRIRFLLDFSRGTCCYALRVADAAEAAEAAQILSRVRHPHKRFLTIVTGDQEGGTNAEEQGRKTRRAPRRDAKAQAE